MKCRACWAEKAFVREVKGWQGMVLACFLRVPLKCHHCYHKFSVFWFSTIGKTMTPPPHLIQAQRGLVLPADRATKAA